MTMIDGSGADCRQSEGMLVDSELETICVSVSAIYYREPVFYLDFHLLRNNIYMVVVQRRCSWATDGLK